MKATPQADGLEDRHDNGNDDACDEDGCNECLIVQVFVGHVEAGDSGDEQADCYNEEEDL
jgi:hypothetical protein